jgi:hypothetical protein
MTKSKKFIRFCGSIEFKAEEFRKIFDEESDTLIAGQYNTIFYTAVTKLVGCNVDVRDSKLVAKKLFTIMFKCGHKTFAYENILSEWTKKNQEQN